MSEYIRIDIGHYGALRFDFMAAKATAQCLTARAKLATAFVAKASSRRAAFARRTFK